MLRPKLCSELRRRVDRRIDVPPESLLSAGQRSHYVLKGRVPHDEQVDIACRPEFAASGRPKHEGKDNLLAECGKSVAEYIDETGGLCKQALQLGKDWRLAVGLKVHLPSLDGAPQKPCRCQQLQLTLYSPHGSARMTGNLTQVIRLVRVTEEPPEDTPSGAAEQQRRRIDIRDFAGCSHDEYKSTQNGNIRSNRSWNPALNTLPPSPGQGAMGGVLETSTNALTTVAFGINEQSKLLNTGRRTAQESRRSMTVGALTSRYVSSTTLTL